MGVPSEAAQFGNFIISKWRDLTSTDNGYFRCHKDGNFDNHDSSNVVLVSPAEAFRALHKGEGDACNWVVGLTDEEIAFVQANAASFYITYSELLQREEAAPASPPAGMYDARLEEDMQAALAHPEVVRLMAEGDAALAAGASERAVELFTAAKHIRDQLLPLNMSMDSSSPTRQARHGRRAGSSAGSEGSAAGSPAGAAPEGGPPAGATPAGASSAGATPAGASSAGSSPVGATPAGSSPAGATPATASPSIKTASTTSAEPAPNVACASTQPAIT
jgi:hypothetical protein